MKEINVGTMNSEKTDISYSAPGQYESARFEKVHNVIFHNSNEASKTVAREISDLIRKKQSEKTPCILGLATGSSPIKVYEELVRLHKEECLSFKNVITFNLDEYYPMKKESIHSYHYFMHLHLFGHVDIAPEHINIPDGELSRESFYESCRAYDEKIEGYGGLDFQLLGIGRTGHIGFNEPGSHKNSVTRDIALDHVTRVDAAPSFQGIEYVPRKAITMGIQTILKAKRIVLIAWGQNKASIIRDTIEGSVTEQKPATYLQEHPNTTFVIDEPAASQLTRIDTPWRVDSSEWTEELTHKAIIWLSKQKGRPVLQLTDKDYNDMGMSDLLAKEGSAYNLNVSTFNRLQRAITGWPGGKPNADDSHRPERALPEKKRVLIFSPHPNDDVISMGGTFDRLVSQGHEVHVAYQTSGSVGVADNEVLKLAEIGSRVSGHDVFENLTSEVNNKGENDIDTKIIRHTKASLRRSEAYAATRFLNIPDRQVHFLDLPFYETGQIKKGALSNKDIQIMMQIIKDIAPHQIYAAGDLGDPNGTQKICLEALLEAVAVLKKEPFMNDCWIWLYRGAWLEWELHEIDMAVPMSPAQVLKKRKAIFFHQSQKDNVMFQGEDTREFWVRAEERNKRTAEEYKDLGLASYAAIEAFARYKF